MKLLLVLMMFGWAGCTQQEEVDDWSINEIIAESWRKDTTKIVIDFSVKFDPNKHYIISVDTVGWQRGLELIHEKYFEGGHWDSWLGSEYDTITGSDKNKDLSYWKYDGWQPTLDTTWADKRPLLLTPQEKDDIMKLITD